MSATISTPHLSLRPVDGSDAEWIFGLLRSPEVRRYPNDAEQPTRETVRQTIGESIDPASGRAVWCIETEFGECVGLVDLTPPSAASLQLRAIGWRSLELYVALEPSHWGHGYAREVVSAIADHASRDGVTFALVGCVAEPNQAAQRLMQKCDFQELGRLQGARYQQIVYERAL